MSRDHAASILCWLQSLGVATAYVLISAGLLWMDLGDAGVAPAWAILAVPAFYAVVLLVLLRRAPLARYLRWTGHACLTHVALGLAAAIAFMVVEDVTALSALEHALVRLGLAPMLLLVTTPLVLAPFRGRVSSARPASRPARTRPASFAAPAVPSEAPVARAPRRRDDGAEAAAPTAPAAPAPAAEVSAPVVDDTAGDDDAVVRVRFERVAGQLPARAFTLPMDRVAESLREPHWITVPRKIVLPMLPEGAIQVPWPIVASQFPALAFAMSDVEFRQKFPDLKLTLPLDDVLRQLPPDTFSMEPAPSRIAGLEAFPAPFQPRAVPRDEPPAPAPARRVRAPADPPELPPDVVTASAPAAPPTPVSTRLRRATPPPAAPVVAPSPPPMAPAPAIAQAPAAARRRDVAAEGISRDMLTRLADCLAGAGTFEAWTGSVEGTPLVAFVAPTVPRDAVTAVAARVVGLLGGAAGEQVTVRTARAAIVVSAAPTAVVVAARRPGAPVALLELRAAHAAGLVGRASEGAALPSRALSALTVEPRVADVASTLGAFGVVEPAVLTDAGGAARVYVFRESDHEAEHVGELALAVWESLGGAPDRDLGALVSVVFRQGRRRILVRPVRGRGTALLAAAGPVAHPGRAWRDADRAAAALETR